MAGSCQYGSELLISIKSGISFLAEYRLASQEELCSMELAYRCKEIAL